MTLEQYAWLAQLLGSVAVVISLIFVGIQLARANNESRAATMQAAMFREMENSFRFADHAGTWDKVMIGEPLEGAELRRALGLFNALMTDCEYRYRQFKAGYLDAQTWEARNATLPSIVSLPIFRTWTQVVSGKNHSADFLAMLEDVARTTSG